MQVRIKQYEKLFVVQIQGELDHHSAPALAKRLDALLSQHAVEELRLDLKTLSFMDSSGIGVLLGRYNRLHAKGGILSVCNPNATIDRIFRLSGLYQIVPKVG